MSLGFFCCGTVCCKKKPNHTETGTRRTAKCPTAKYPRTICIWSDR